MDQENSYRCDCTGTGYTGEFCQTSKSFRIFLSFRRICNSTRVEEKDFSTVILMKSVAKCSAITLA